MPARARARGCYVRVNTASLFSDASQAPSNKIIMDEALLLRVEIVLHRAGRIGAARARTGSRKIEKHTRKGERRKFLANVRERIIGRKEGRKDVPATRISVY